MFDFLMAALGPGTDKEKVRLYCDPSIDQYHWLVGNGVHFNPDFHPDPVQVPSAGKSLMYSGGENAWPFSEFIPPAPRGPMVNRPPGLPSAEQDETERHGSYWLMQALTDRCAAKGVRVEYNVRADQLIVGAIGQVRA
jgi:3-oxo-5alpha-steroid 4-dehydrogenase